MDVTSKANSWLSHPIDDADKQLIHELLQPGQEENLIDAFYKDLEFGTGGLRGIMGIGSNRMNKYTVAIATQGLANYLLKTFNENISVAIAYDCRNNSQFFAETASKVFIGNGIKVNLFKDLRPTPELSFTVRHLKCQAGIVITASHNPKEYNGYKAYWNDGAQITPPHDQNIIDEVNKIENISQVKMGDLDKANLLGKEIDEIYLKNVLQLIDPSLPKNIDVVYSSIHGTGISLIPDLLLNSGYRVTVVDEQKIPDGNFPTVIYPNPEEKEAMTLALDLARNKQADLAMATDPDADRVGIAIPNNQGEYILLNGNQTGVLLMHYLINKVKSQLKGNEFIVSTIVTTELIERIAESLGVKCYTTLTGFKHIAKVVKDLEGQESFIAGCEESYGYMIGDFVRDKDAVSACLLIAEMTAFAKTKGWSLHNYLINIFLEYGIYQESLVSLVREGQKGAEEISNMMKQFRMSPPQFVNGSKVIRIVDYQNRTNHDLVNDKIKNIDLPVSNVLQYYTKDGSKISMRPSGTEPKIKFYISVNTQLDSAENYDFEKSQLLNKIKKIETEIIPF